MAFYTPGKSQLDQRHLDLSDFKSRPSDKGIDINRRGAEGGDDLVAVAVRERRIRRRHSSLLGFCLFIRRRWIGSS
jgi:hypothetical protein